MILVSPVGELKRMEGVFSLTSYFAGQDLEPHSEQEVNKILYLPVHATSAKYKLGASPAF